MTYKEFKKRYAWTLKNYPTTDNLFEKTDLFRIETINYERPDAGSKWIETSRKIELASVEFYMNTVDAIPFFRKLGGREMVKAAWNKFGYMPYFIASMNPDGTKKTTRRFIFNQI